MKPFSVPNWGVRLFVVLLLFTGLTVVITVQAQPAATPEFPRQPFRTIEQLERWPGAEEPDQSMEAPSNYLAEGSLHWARKVFQVFGFNNRWDIQRDHPDGGGYQTIISHGSASIHPHQNRGSTHIVFAARVGSSFEIFRATIAGTQITQLTFTGSDNVYPAWSPDGSKIAFQSYRDGRAEIYIMNADGSSQTRLTNNPGYDGMPTWSPDGSKIAFTSFRNGAQRIYVMNADGSQLTQLSAQPHSAYPNWSPDGTRIAFSADSDGDGWLELWVMNADGSNQQLLVNPPGQADAWASGWSPTSKQVTYTLVNFVFHQGQWYWETAYLYGHHIDFNHSSLLVYENRAWHLHWETADITPPVSSLTPLAAELPYAFNLEWSGYDIGPAGIRGYDLQYRQGQHGQWTDLLDNTLWTQFYFSGGLGGETYHFRLRGRDFAGNIENWRYTSTTIESRPPRTTVQPLPPFTHIDQPIVVHWLGYDPGGSGIATYQTQYRVGDSDWVDWWELDEYDSAVAFEDGVAGNTYSFRIRGIDWAQNVEAWHSEEGDATTTVYNTAVTGIVQDNSGTPVQAISLTTDPPPLHSFTGDEDGRYASYLALDDETYAVDWSKAGYGTLPTTTLPTAVDTRLPIVLPPADNVLQDSGFESGDLTLHWSPGGTLLPVITTTRQTGQYAAFLGQNVPPFINSELIGNTLAQPQVVVTPNQVVHAVWAHDSSLLYRQRHADGGWTDPEVVASNALGGSIRLAVGANNSLHLIWQTTTAAYYAQRPFGGSWSSPQLIHSIGEHDYMQDMQMIVAANGVIHIAWGMRPDNDYSDDIFYARRAANGVWSAPHNVSNTYGESSREPQLGLDEQGIVHLLWVDHIDIFYARRTAAGHWSSPLAVSSQSGNPSLSPRLAVEPGGTAHVSWYYLGDIQSYYRQRNAQGNWTAVQPVNLGLGVNSLTLDNAGNLHFTGGSPHPRHLVRYANGTFSPVTILIPPDLSGSGVLWLHMDQMGDAHLINYHYSSERYYYLQWIAGNWSVPQQLIGHLDSNPVFDLSLALDDFHQAHILWRSAHQHLYYFGPEISATADTIQLAQPVTISTNLATPTLSFLYRAGGLTPSSSSNLTVLLDDGLTTTTIANLPGSAVWQPVSFDLSDWLGQAVTLRLQLEQTEGTPVAWVYLDEVTLGSTYPDVWVKGSQVNAFAGKQAVLTLAYGNRGGAAAADVQLTYTLPAELTFVSASLPPISHAPLIWDFGDLPARSEPSILELVVAVSPNAPGFTELVGTAVIVTNSPELEMVNNSTQTVVYTAGYLHLPIIAR